MATISRDSSGSPDAEGTPHRLVVALFVRYAPHGAPGSPRRTTTKTAPLLNLTKAVGKIRPSYLLPEIPYSLHFLCTRSPFFFISVRQFPARDGVIRA